VFFFFFFFLKGAKFFTLDRKTQKNCERLEATNVLNFDFKNVLRDILGRVLGNQSVRNEFDILLFFQI